MVATPSLESDPIDWELNRNGQLIIPIRYIRGLPAVQQRVRIRLKLFRGEWFLNINSGMPYLPTADGLTVPRSEALLGNRFDPVRTRAAYRREILSTPGVIKLLELNLAFDGATRIVSSSWRARTAFGDTPLDTFDKAV